MLEHKVEIPNASAKDIYHALLSTDEHSKIIGDKANVSDKVGGTFTTFSGYAEGKNIELIPNEKIVQTWRASDWPPGHFSTITFRFKNTDNGAEIYFTQENLPQGTIDEFDAGWKDNYWDNIIEFFKK